MTHSIIPANQLAKVKAALEYMTKGTISGGNEQTKEALSILDSLQEVEVVGYADEFGNFEKNLHHWMKEEPNVNWQPLYGSKT